MKKLLRVGLGALLVMTLLVVGGGCAQKDTLTIFHAGSLAAPLEAASSKFEEIYPNVGVQTESAGSLTTIRKVTEMGKLADVIGSSDYQAIEQLMFPDFTDWYLIFASNAMVIAYTDESQYGDEINRDNWYQILTREGVEYGRADPNADPNGYRTLMVWQLAEQYYEAPGLYQKLLAGSPDKNIRPKETDLIALLQSGELDYAFEYRSIAQQRGLRFVELPPQINLADVQYQNFYATAKVEVAGDKPGTTQTMIGETILYAVTIPKNAPRPDLGIAFLKFLLGVEGQAIIEENGQSPIVPAITNDWTKLPPELRSYASERK